MGRADLELHSLVQRVGDFAVGSEHEDEREHEQHEVEENRVHLLHVQVVPELNTLVVAGLEWDEFLIDGDRDSNDEGEHPHGADHAVRVRQGLPAPGAQRLADGEVALQGDGHQREDGYRHTHTCERHKTKRFSIVHWVLDGIVARLT